MIVQRYCQSRGHADGQVAVNLTLELADNPKRVKSIVVDLEVPGDVPEDRKEAIRRVAEHCVVQETLKSPPDVDLDVVIGAH